MNIGEVRRGNRGGAAGSRDGAPPTEIRPGQMAKDAYTAASASRAAPGWWDRVKSWASGAFKFVGNFFDHQDSWVNPAARPPASPGKLSVASYNIELGGKHIEQVEANLRDLDPDVVALQEASLDSVKRLAEKLGYHYAFATTPWHTSGKAILSRYPIKGFEDRPYRSVPLWDRVKAFWNDSAKQGDWKSVEPLYQRSVLQATLQVGSRTVDVLDTHLSLRDAPSNAAQLRELTEIARQSAARGRTVVAAGDFNTNFALAGEGVADAPGQVDTVTDTVREFKERYPKSIVGNIGNSGDKKAALGLLDVLKSFWDSGKSRQIRVEGDLVEPGGPLAELEGGEFPVGSFRFDRRMNAADGVSHRSANKRFDNVFVSPDAQVDRALIDQDVKGSDHQPVLAEISWR